jgi:hypothetical protein
LSGVFRSSLRWVAIVQALRAETDAARAPMRAQLANAQAGVDAAVGLIDALSDTTKAALTGLLAGEWIASDPRSLARLLGGGSLHADAGKSQEAKTQAEWSNHLTSALASPEPPSWLARLVSDLERGADSRLLEDARTCLRWAFAEPEPWPDARPLYQEIFPDPAATAALGTIVTLGNLRDRLGPPRSWGAADLRHWDEWLRRRLHQDPRAASLLGWLLVQALGRETRFDPHDQKAVTEVLPGGGKSLVFSEYTDTLDYLSCLVLVLGHVGRASSDLVVGVGAWTATLELLKTAMREVIAVAGREARQERARSRGFLEPVAAGWFEQEVSGPAGLERIRRACVRLADEAGLCTGGPHGLLVKNGEAQPPLFDTGAEPTTEDGLEGSDAGVVVERAAVLDAFSPFYQIDPKTRDVDEQSRIRDALAAATARPVHALFATQVLAEGVNLQECGVVVHYDLPWNPTSLVQRNGRVDRRITNVYEDQYQRFKLLDGLGLADSTPPFMAVKQVYHLTVLPAEPSLAAGSPVQFAAADAARSVRATLLRKLNAIRCLFGLSAWPVVLDITDAAAVLTGELDFETPGIRRREELFKQWHALGARIGEFVPPPTGTLLCGVALGDAPGLSEFEAHVAPPARAMPRAVGIQTWDPWKGRLLPVRSGIEWRDRPAITGWLWTNDGALRAWLPRKRESHGRQRFEPVWAEHEARPEAKRNGRTWPLQGLPGGVAAPTSLAEDWLTYFAQAFLDDAKWLDYEPMARYVLPASLLAGTTLQGAGRWFGWIADAAPRSQGDDREVLDSARYEVPSHKLPAELPAVADAQGWNLLAFLDDDLDPSGDDA